MSGVSLATTSPLGCVRELLTWAARAACNSKSGLSVGDSDPVPEQTNTRKSWPKTGRRPPALRARLLLVNSGKSRPEVQEPGGFLGGRRRRPLGFDSKVFFHT